jgi:hypothetical protein
LYLDPFSDIPTVWGIHVVWASKGIAFEGGGYTPSPAIDANLILEWVHYYQPGIEHFLEISGELFDRQALVEWEGFAEFDEYMGSAAEP